MTFGLKSRTRIGTWNVRTLLEPSRLAQVSRELSNYKLLLLGLSEVRWPGSGESTTGDGLTFLYSGRDPNEHRASGVGFLLSKQAKKALLDWRPVSDRIIVIRLRSRVRNVTCIQCYAPTEPSPAEAKEEFYSTLEHTMREVNHVDIKILMGDLNAQVGKDNTNCEQVMGRHGIGNKNENGDLFIEFCSTNNLVIGGTLFPHKDIHKATWNSPDQTTRNQIDHIAINKRWRSSFLDVRNRRGADAASDHHLVIGEIRLKIAKVATKHDSSRRKKFNIRKLKTPAVAENFQAKLRNEARDQSQEILRKEWDLVKKLYSETATTVLGIETPEQKAWISDETWKLIEERKTAKANLNLAKTRRAKLDCANAHSTLNREVKRSAKRDKRRWADQLAQRAQVAADTHNLRELYQITRKLANRCSQSNQPLRDNQDRIETSPNKQLDIWHDYYTNLLNPPYFVGQQDELVFPVPNGQIPILNMDIATPGITEITGAIRQLKMNKAAGPDDIPSELLKADSETGARLLLPFIEEFWNNEQLTSDWKVGLVIKLPKKGDLRDCRNWRGITLLNSCNKVLTQIIHNRMAPILNQGLRQEQTGFRPNMSCIDHINTLRIVTEQSVEWRSPLFMLFIDFERAFDSLNHNAIWQALAIKGVPDKLINLISELYSDASCRILHRGLVSKNIPAKTGVRQGCLLSPLLFNVVLDVIMSNAINNDICLLAHTQHDMELQLNSLVELANKTGLRINIPKTKCIRLNTTNTRLFRINNQLVGEVNQFCYLGSIISKDGGAELDIAQRIEKARQAFGILNPIWKSSVLSTKTKLRIFNTNVKAVLLYGCETWNTSKTHTHKLQVFINKCLRKLLRIFWPERISNAALWTYTNQRCVQSEVKLRKWRWIGHILRKQTDNIARVALDWNPQGSRRRGRPSNTWRRSIDKEAGSTGKTWREIKAIAPDRNRWKIFVEALCSS